MKYWLSIFLTGAVLAGCSPNNVSKDESLGNYFKEAGVEGSFALFNNANGEFTVYNLARYRDSAYTPAATFDIVTSLIGLQVGTIVNDSMVIAGSTTGCNGDLSMYSAFRQPCPGWYSEIARRIGKDTLQRWVDSLSYGSKKIGALDSFWLDNSLKVRPDEQLGLVKRLYFNQLPFFKLNQEIVKRAMLMEDEPNYKLGYKTGAAKAANGNTVAWVVGWVEENRHPYFFAINYETSDANLNANEVGVKILKGALTQLGFLQGKK